MPIGKVNKVIARSNPILAYSEHIYYQIDKYALTYPIIFTLLYLISASVQANIQYPSNSSTTALFATMPFRQVVQISSQSRSVFGLTLDSYFLVLLLMFVTNVYYKYLIKGLEGLVTMRSVFLAGIVASYAAELVNWYYYGLPYLNNSIIGFTLMLFLALAIFCDLKFYRGEIIPQIRTHSRYLSSRRMGRKFNSTFGVTFPFVMFIVALVVLVYLLIGIVGFYILGNSNYATNLVGGFFFMTILFLSEHKELI